MANTGTRTPRPLSLLRTHRADFRVVGARRNCSATSGSGLPRFERDAQPSAGWMGKLARNTLSGS